MDRFKYEFKVKIMEESKVRARSLAHNILRGGVEGRAGAPGWD
jgi:hypothetical protein